MPITKSAKKSLKVSRTKTKQNVINTAKLEKAIRTVTKENVNSVISLIDKAAKTGLIHQNKAARIKSSLVKKYGSPKKVKKVSDKIAKTVKKPVKKTAKKTSKK